ncbi:MAG: hypothetical protein WC045_00435 [Patescibacteria group bacterium]
MIDIYKISSAIALAVLFGFFAWEAHKTKGQSLVDMAMQGSKWILYRLATITVMFILAIIIGIIYILVTS